MNSTSSSPSRSLPRVTVYAFAFVAAAICLIGCSTVSASSQSAASSSSSAPFASSPLSDIRSRLSSYSTTTPRIVSDVAATRHSHHVLSHTNSAHADLNAHMIAYPHTLNITIEINKRVYTLILAQNVDLVADEYKTIDGQNKTSFGGVGFSPCHYNGHVAGVAGSTAAISTCDNQINGLVYINATYWGITPVPIAIPSTPTAPTTTPAPSAPSVGAAGSDASASSTSTVSETEIAPGVFEEGSHIVYDIDNYDVGTGAIDHNDDLPTAAAFASGQTEAVVGHNADAAAAAASAASAAATGTGTIPTPHATSALHRRLFGAHVNAEAVSNAQGVKVVELIVINDAARVAIHGAKTEQHSLGILNMISSMYDVTDFGAAPSTYNPATGQFVNGAGRVRVKIKVVAQYSATRGDPYSIPTSSDQTVRSQGTGGLLERFNEWASGYGPLPKKRDSIQLFSGLTFSSGVLGLANVGQMCVNQYSGSVTSMNEPSDLRNAIIGAHETGHVLGMMHDGSNNECPTSGYVMASVAGVGAKFSSCSKNAFLNWLSTSSSACLDD